MVRIGNHSWFIVYLFIGLPMPLLKLYWLYGSIIRESPVKMSTAGVANMEYVWVRLGKMALMDMSLANQWH